ncbi:LPS O-antigen chain length determinant protein WzzB [Saccharospirillum mangrovi]|uniref:LPS O-antigen chain length determinant protein WzzB n=1 Tax=Saccharospirillum mangrovi TaxID=2161747 RepID=UPI000D38E9F5|nr:Wzz/FepE/Etk N-terminal domain-containing protein [Saccharospirillum mangrovi]
MSPNEQQHDLAHLNPHHHDDDTIDLGALLRGLFEQWKLIGAIAGVTTVLAVVVALILPNKFKVEAIVSEPTRRDVQALLAQSVEPITVEDISRTLLVNIQSFSLVRGAYEESGMAEQAEETNQTEEERVSTIRDLQRSLVIEPVDLSFLGETDTTSLENVSVSLLSTNPAIAKNFLDLLVTGAANKTLDDYKRNIEAARDIRIAHIRSQLNSIERSAEAALERRTLELEQALSIADSLNIEEPTNWDALVHGADNGQYINLREQTNGDLFMQGTRIIRAQLEGLRREGTNRLFESSIQETQVVTPDAANRNSNELVVPVVTNRTISPIELRGELAALQDIRIDLSRVALVEDDNLASIPANADSPNRKLIVAAALVLGGFLGIFVALIRMAVRDDEHH